MCSSDLLQFVLRMNGKRGKAGEELGKGSTRKRKGVAEAQGENKQGKWGDRNRLV